MRGKEEGKGSWVYSASRKLIWDFRIGWLEGMLIIIYVSKHILLAFLWNYFFIYRRQTNHIPLYSNFKKKKKNENPKCQ